MAPPGPLPPFTASSLARAEAKAQLMMRLRAQGDLDLALLRALDAAPREIFVGPAFVDLALRDVAIPLPFGQTMEAPSALARMIAALDPGPGSRILEIGAGSGFSAKVLAMLGREVVSVDCIERLVLDARARLERLNVANVAVVWADGFEISPSYGLFDRIVVHGALDEIPASIAGALAEGGVLVAPRRGAGEGICELARHVRTASGVFETNVLGPWRAQRLLRGMFSDR
jgi:protein-L-isoaspartate(D-aspartate) O-methyltransferase